jgi:ECF transporter S component (folate family)
MHCWKWARRVKNEKETLPMKTMKPMKTTWNTKTLAMLGVLIALAIVASRYLVINPSPTLRFSFAFTFVILAGIWFGPVSGAMVGCLEDILGCMIGGSSIFLPLTVSPILAGLLAGLLSPIFRKSKNVLVYGIGILGITLMTTMLYSTWVLSRLYGNPYPALFLSRIPQGVCATAVNTILVYAIYHSPVTRFVRQIQEESI